MDAYEDIVDIITAIIVIFLFTLVYFGQKQDAIVQSIVSMETKGLVDEVRSKGYITKDMYNTYLTKVAETRLLYDISLEHRQLAQEPEYRFRTLEEIIGEQDSSYAGSNSYTYRPITTQQPEVDDPVSSGSLNTETNESVLASAINTPADPSHVHFDSCYNGVKHVHTGNSTSGGGCYGGINYKYHAHTSSCYHTHTGVTGSCYTSTACGGTSKYSYTGNGSYGSYLCSVCGTEVYDGYVEYYICRLCGASMGYITHNLNTSCCGIKLHNGGNVVTDKRITSCTKINYLLTCKIDPTVPICGKTTSTTEGIASYYMNCGKTAGLYYNGNTQVFPICSQQVQTIVPTHPTQTVNINDPLITTVTASYLDGSTKVVAAVTTFSTASVAQNQSVILTYNYAISGVPYSKTCTINVTVIPRSKTCVNGHSYNLNSDGTDPECPYCKAWLSSLEIAVPPSGNITIYKGTSLQENGVTLLAVYLDGRTEYFSGGYIDNFDNQYVGTQDVTISYKGKYVTLKITTRRNLILCPVCSRYYELYPDGTDPGCPHCLSVSPIFTGNIMKYYNERYTDKILKELYESSGIYYLEERDYFLLTVKNIQGSWGSKILAYFNLKGSYIQSMYGGYVREDGYRD